MQRDAAAGGNVPAHGGEALVALAPGLERIAPFRIEDWARVPACHLGPDRLWALRERVRQVAESGEVTRDRHHARHRHPGGDRLPARSHPRPRQCRSRSPGAMRTSSDTAWDGPRNLLRCRGGGGERRRARARGVVVVFNGEIFAGRTAAKTHATDVAAFSAPHAGPIGRVEEGRVVYAIGRQRLAPSRSGHTRWIAARSRWSRWSSGDDGAGCSTWHGRSTTASSSRRSEAETFLPGPCPLSDAGWTRRSRWCWRPAAPSVRSHRPTRSMAAGPASWRWGRSPPGRARRRRRGWS